MNGQEIMIFFKVCEGWVQTSSTKGSSSHKIRPCGRLGGRRKADGLTLTLGVTAPCWGGRGYRGAQVLVPALAGRICLY